MAGQILTAMAMEKPCKNRDGKASKYKPHLKSLQIKIPIGKPSNSKLGWKSLQI